jgi:hypothetical protein
MTDMNETNYYIEVPLWVEEIKKQCSSASYKAKLEARFACATDPEEKELVGTYLAMTYISEGLIGAARDVLMALISDQPKNPIRWIALADFERSNANLEASNTAANTAVKLARENHQFLRYSLGTKARTLKYMERYEELESCLLELAELEPQADRPDFPPERDFFVSVDPAKFSPATVRRYQEYLDRWKGKTHPAWDGMAGQ